MIVVGKENNKMIQIFKESEISTNFGTMMTVPILADKNFNKLLLLLILLQSISSAFVQQ